MIWEELRGDLTLQEIEKMSQKTRVYYFVLFRIMGIKVKKKITLLHDIKNYKQSLIDMELNIPNKKLMVAV